jgi:phospholipid/cholesterol/gamma-HCH transport system substrate-binding protein
VRRPLMLKYRGRKLSRVGILAVTLILLIVTVGLQPERIIASMTSLPYQAEFADAGGLAVGNDVTRSGIKVGAVSAISLQRGVALVTFTVDARRPLGSQTSAHIRTGTLLGQRVLTLESHGEGRMHPTDVIPLSRTSSPYSLTEAVSELTTDTAATDTVTLNQSLDTLSQTLDQIAPQLGPTFDGVTRLSRAVNARDESLSTLLKSTSKVTEILAQRSDGINALILNANDLVGVLNDRREALVALLSGIGEVSNQLIGLVKDNETELAPALNNLNQVAAMLERNRDNIGKAIPGFAKYQLTQNEAFSNGHYYNAYTPNLIPAQTLQPFLDYAFGFRRGTDAGQPPDTAGPRAEFPLPFNAIPGGS